MRTQTREKLFSIFTSLTLLFQYFIGIFSYLPAPVYADRPIDNGSGNLDQAKNGPEDSPLDPPEWTNQNLNAQHAHYLEGDSVPYRLLFGDLSAGAHSVTIEWDTTQGGKHSTDYLTSFDETEETANPCFGVGSCGAPDIESIPDDPNATVTQVPGNFTLYNGIITSVSPYTLSGSYGGNSSTRVTINFTTSVSDPVLAWGGHIGSQMDWGTGNSAVNINGSSYHMRFIDLDGSGGNQDRSLSADAVIPPGFLTIVKDVVPDDASQWNFQVTGPDGYSSGTTLGDGSSTVFIVNPGAYTASETTSSSYSTVVSCIPTEEGGTSSVVVDISSEESVTCTFVNTIHNGSITVAKVTNPVESTQTFDFDLGGGTPDSTTLGSGESHTFENLLPGAYSLTEDDSVLGWDLTGAVCDDVSYTNGDTIDLSAGENVTCTFTNERLPLLTVIKEIVNDNGGTAIVDNYSLYVGQELVVSEDQEEFDPDFYQVSEIGPDGYIATFSDDCDLQGGVNLAYGDEKTCTITNDDVAPTLTLVKTVTNNDGGQANANQWTLQATGTDGFSGSGPTVGPQAVLAGEPYTLSESGGPSGYTPSDWQCDGGQLSGNVITLGLAEDVTCTIENDDEEATLILAKILPNDNGGTATEDDFNVYINDVLSSWGSHQVDAGTYTVSEDTLSGYTPFSWGGDCNAQGEVALLPGETITCTILNDDETATLTLVKVLPNDDGGTATENDFAVYIDTVQSSWGFHYVDAGSYTVSEDTLFGYVPSTWGEDCDAQGNVTLLPGESKTCTITNDDVAPTLTLVKTVENDNFGTKQVADFPLFINGNSVTSGVASTLSANVPYTATETNLYGYSASVWGGDCAADGTITLNEGDNKTCTITNDDIQPLLTVTKIVFNNDGGTLQVFDFPLFVDSTSVTSGVQNGFNAGSYTISETNIFGYDAVISGDCFLDGSVTLGVGDTKSCTITNMDIAPTLKLVKVVDNGNGGNAVSGDWTLFAIAGEDESIIDSGDSTQFHPAIAGITYTLSESDDPGGYLASGWSCDGGSLEGDELVLGLDEDVTCTITNDDIAPTITLYKEVINNNGGEAGPNDFGLTVGGASVTSGVPVSVQANTPIALDEAGLSGYAFVSITGDEEREDDCPSVLGGTVTLDEGENLTCTITNDDIAPQLTVIKRVVNNGTPPGTKVAGDFTLSVAGTNPDPVGFPGNESGIVVTLDAGQYEVTEEPVAGYTAFYSDECSGTIGVGEEKTCTVTNNDQDVLGEETEDGEVLGEELPDTGIPMINLLFAALAFEVGLYLRRRSRRA